MISWMEEGGRAPEMIRDLSDELCAPGEGGALLIGGPSWVRTPPELGSKKMSIIRQGTVDMNCPVCRRQRPVYVLELEDDIHVSCCENCKQYGWFKLKGEK